MLLIVGECRARVSVFAETTSCERPTARTFLDGLVDIVFSEMRTSADFPITPGAIQPAYGGGDIDAFLLFLAGRPS